MNYQSDLSVENTEFLESFILKIVGFWIFN